MFVCICQITRLFFLLHVVQSSRVYVLLIFVGSPWFASKQYAAVTAWFFSGRSTAALVKSQLLK